MGTVMGYHHLVHRYTMGTPVWYRGTVRGVRSYCTEVRSYGMRVRYGTVIWYDRTHTPVPKKNTTNLEKNTTNSIDCVVFFSNWLCFFWYAPSFVVYHVYLVSCTTRTLEPVPCVPSYSTTVPYHRAVP